MSIKKNPIDFTIGADPEFVSVFKRKVIIASDYVDIHDKFGRDAYEKLFELKPNPSKCPLEVTENLKEIIKHAVVKNPNFLKWRWICDSFYMNCPMGGHLHAGISPKIISAKDACSQFLDHYVGAITLILEDKKKGLARRQYRRKNYRYGFASDFREKQHGFEYRSPSSWITTPEVAAAILSLFKVICYEMINNKSFVPRKFVEPVDFDTMNVEKIRENFPFIWQDIQLMSLYPKYKEQLSLIYKLVKNQRTWLSTKDMKETWGILNFTKDQKLNPTLEDIWSGIENL